MNHTEKKITGKPGETRIRTQITFILIVFSFLAGSTVSADIISGFAGVPAGGPAPLIVSFLDQSTSTKEISGYEWDFGDKTNTSTEKNPTHTYPGPGRYTVSLKVTDITGANNTTTKASYIHVEPSEYPVVKFMATPRAGAAPQTVGFLDQSLLDPAVPDEMYTYLWNFGDGTGNSSNSRNIQHTYTKQGTYTAQLEIEDQNGAKHRASAPVQISITNGTSSFAALFTGVPSTGSAPLTVSFIDQSTSPVPVIGYAWDFGDNTNISTEKNPVHTYQAIGTYTVSLNITNADGANTSVSQAAFIQVQPSEYPVVKFTATPGTGTAPQAVMFLDQSALDPAVPDEMYSYIWSFGDGTGNSSNSRNIQHTYTKQGTYTAQLEIEDQNGAKHRASAPVQISITNGTSSFAALFTGVPSTGPAPLTVSFIDQSTSPVPVTGYTWDFGDNTNISTEKNPVHTYQAIGTYTVSLNITNADGANTSVSQAAFIQVQPSEYPVVKFTATPGTGTAPQAVMFLDQSALDPAVPDEMYSYIWSFGDGMTDSSNIRNIQHTYTKQGTYSAQLEIDDQNGAKHRASAPVIITITSAPPPVPPVTPVIPVINDTTPYSARFTAVPLSGPAPLTVSFIDQSTSPVPITGFAWDFGDKSNTSTERNPVHTYREVGNYTVSLNITNADGRNAAVTMPAYIDAGPSGFPVVMFTAVPQNVTTGQEVYFIDQSVFDSGGGTNYTYIWNFGDNSTSSPLKARNTLHSYTRGGDYPVQLQIQDQNGVLHNSTVTMKIHVIPLTTPVITATSTSNGKITPSGQVSVSPGSDQRFNLTPDTGYRIDDLQVDSASVGVPGTYLFTNVLSDHTIHASFSSIPPANHTVTAGAGEGGSISPSGAILVPDGGSISFAITPDTGYTIEKVLINGKNIGPVSSSTFQKVVSDRTIYASFRKN